MEVSLHRDAVGNAVLHAIQCLPDKRHTAGIIGGGNAVFGHDQVTLEFLCHLANDVFQCLRIDLVVHLGQFCALRCRQLPLRAIKGAGIVLHTQKIIVFDIRQIMGELLLPCGLGKGFAAGLCLQVVQRKGQAHLDLRAEGFDGIPCGCMGTHHQQITFRGALADKDLRLGCAEHLCILHGSILHVFHHLLEVHAHLHRALGRLSGRCGILGSPFCHQTEPLGDRGQLQAHIGLVDGADIAQLAAQLFHHIGHITFKILYGAFGFPAALADEPFRAGKVQQGDDGFYAMRFAAGDHLAVMLDSFRVELSFLRLYPCPLDRKAVGVQPGIGQELDIFFVPLIMVTGNAAGLRKAGMGQLLLCPVVTIRIVALYLMGCCCSTDEKAFFKFLHDGSPFLRVAC